MTTDAINKAFQEDEAIKLTSQKRSIQYLKDIEDEENKIPLWCWCFGSFAIGMIFAAVFISNNLGLWLLNIFV